MSILSNIEPFRSKIEAKKLLLCPPKKREKRHMLCYVNYTKTSLQRCLFENILAIHITCTNTYYERNTDSCYTVIIIKNNQNCQKYQNSCCVIGLSVFVFWVLMILHHSDCLDCLDYYIAEIAAFHFVYPADAYFIYHIGEEMQNLQDLCHHLQFLQLKTLHR